MRGQLKEASSATSKAIYAFGSEMDPYSDMFSQSSDEEDDSEEEPQMSWSVAIMKPVLRYLQLLCENHNSDLQVLKPA